MSRARDLAKLGNTNVIAVNGTDVGFGTLDPKEKVNVVGVVSATSFYGDGSALDGIASAGIGTALSDDKTKALNAIYYTNEEILVNTTSTVNPPASGHIAYTQAPTLVIDDTKELTVSDGDDLLVDVLGISTGTNVDYAARGNGVFGNIYVDNIWNQSGQTSVNFPKGLVSSGVATFTSDVSIGGTLTYEDVKNVDSVGLITARTGIKVTAGGIDVTAGVIKASGDGINASSNLILKTAATERLRIGAAGQLGLAGANYGTSGQVLTSQGGSAAVQWATPSGGGWIPLLSNTATSGTEILATTNLLTSTYQQYSIEFYCHTPTAGAVFLQQYDSGAYRTGTDYDYRMNYSIHNQSNRNGADGVTTNVPVNAQGNFRASQGSIRIWNPSGTTVQSTWVCNTDSYDTNQPSSVQNSNRLGIRVVCSAANGNTPVAVTGFKLYAEQTIAISYATLYGLKTS